MFEQERPLRIAFEVSFTAHTTCMHWQGTEVEYFDTIPDQRQGSTGTVFPVYSKVRFTGIFDQRFSFNGQQRPCLADVALSLRWIMCVSCIFIEELAPSSSMNIYPACMSKQ